MAVEKIKYDDFYSGTTANIMYYNQQSVFLANVGDIRICSAYMNNYSNNLFFIII
jgi:hypothetical protein